MPDLILLAVFGILAVAGAGWAVFCLRRALRTATEKNGEFRMFLWGVGTMAGLIVAGMSTAYILLPILFGR
jgi:hypothetical protein